MTKQDKEAQLFSMLNLIADKYKMKIEIKGNIINLVGDYDKATELACAMELEEIFGNHERII